MPTINPISPSSSDGPRLTWLGRMVIVLFIAACAVGAYSIFRGKHPIDDARRSAGTLLGSGPTVEIGVAFGTEKQRWLEWAVAEFAKTAEGKSVKVNLIPMGSLEGARALIGGDQRIHVWSPASAAYKDI